jgi:predicted XRE-type DNA-binding protein
MNNIEKALNIVQALKTAGVSTYKIENQLDFSDSLFYKLSTGRVKSFSDDKLAKLTEYADNHFTTNGFNPEIMKNGIYITKVCKDYQVTPEELVEGFKKWHLNMAKKIK